MLLHLDKGLLALIFGKGLHELYEIGIIDHMPRIAVIQAEGANPLYRSYQNGLTSMEPVHAETVATAIKIGNPVNFKKAVRTLKWTNGVVEEVSDQEIIERLIYALVNEAAHILEEGNATRASDIDMVYLTGYGFPLHRGGPMFYADTVGLPNVVMAMDKYAKGRHGDAWKIAPLLAKLAAEGKSFNG